MMSGLGRELSQSSFAASQRILRLHQIVASGEDAAASSGSGSLCCGASSQTKRRRRNDAVALRLRREELLDRVELGGIEAVEIPLSARRAHRR